MHLLFQDWNISLYNPLEEICFGKELPSSTLSRDTMRVRSRRTNHRPVMAGEQLHARKGYMVHGEVEAEPGAG
jgi:hypothetical protein